MRKLVMGKIISDIAESMEIYDWIFLLYIIVGISSLIWASIGNDYVFGRIDRKEKKNIIATTKKRTCDVFFEEMKRSWLREQNIWKSVEYFLIGLSYLSMVITLYIAVDNIIENMLMLRKVTFYTIINLLSSSVKDYLVPNKKSLGVRKAYLILNEAIMMYEYGKIEIEELYAAVVKGENLITIYTYED